MEFSVDVPRALDRDILPTGRRENWYIRIQSLWISLEKQYITTLASGLLDATHRSGQ